MKDYIIYPIVDPRKATHLLNSRDFGFRGSGKNQTLSLESLRKDIVRKYKVYLNERTQFTRSIKLVEKKLNRLIKND